MKPSFGSGSANYSDHTEKPYVSCVSGGKAFTIDMWGKDSDPLLQAIFFCAYMGAMACVQLSKLFLAERFPMNNWKTTNLPPENQSEQHFHPNMTNLTHTQTYFESDVEIVYFVVGALSVVGSAMQILNFLQSGCRLSHLDQNTEETSLPVLHGEHMHMLTKFNLFFASILLFLITFFGITNEESFICFGLTFAIYTMEWTSNDASNYITVFFISELLSLCLSIIFTKYIHVHKLLLLSIFSGLAGTLFMTLALKATSFSLWIGACLLGFGTGNLVANTLNTGRRLTNHTGFISFILASSYTGRMVAPILIGYLYEHVDPMWYLYLGVACFSGMLVLFLAFHLVLWCSRQFVSVQQQECDVPLEQMLPKQQH